ncbi:uncharacterized protein [Anolis sagrei]|uniref:uncharacterized protein isoform X2 n=1 Tax=Anolis sagrei TaxID=38937 RepID=UPI003521DD92
MERGCCQGAHPLRLMHLHLLLLLFISFSVALKRRWRQHHDTGGLSEDVSCLNKWSSSGRSVSCTWWPHNQSLGQGPFYLQFSDPSGLLSSLICCLSPSPKAGGLYSCIAEGDGEFTENDEYRVTLHANSSSSSGKNVTVFELYKPKLHIQFDVPIGLQSHVNATKCRIQWEKAEDDDGFIVEWQWQLEFKHDKEPWEQATQKNFATQESWVDIDSSELKCGEKVVRIRRKVPDEDLHYRGPWSPWSPSMHCAALPDCGQKQSDLRFLWTWPASLPLGLGTLLFLLLSFRFLWRAGLASKGEQSASAATQKRIAFAVAATAAIGAKGKSWKGPAPRSPPLLYSSRPPRMQAAPRTEGTPLASILGGQEWQTCRRSAQSPCHSSPLPFLGLPGPWPKQRERGLLQAAPLSKSWGSAGRQKTSFPAAMITIAFGKEAVAVGMAQGLKAAFGWERLLAKADPKHPVHALPAPWAR